jgi:hypothetical protein
MLPDLPRQLGMAEAMVTLRMIIGILLVVAYQLLALVLFIIGLPVCAIGAALPLRYDIMTDQYHFGWRGFWLWDNDQDGILLQEYAMANPTWSRWRLIFVWTAWRNSVHNLMFVFPVKVSPQKRSWSSSDRSRNLRYSFALQGLLFGGYVIASRPSLFVRFGWWLDKAPGTVVPCALSVGRNNQNY